VSDPTPGPPIPARAPELFQRALAFALDWHGEQTRKGSDIPYVSHLLQVAGLVLENGGDWEQAAAAMVHDSVEDVRGVHLGTIERAFGPRVARIVGDCTDTLPGDTPESKSPWIERKRGYLDRLAAAGADSLLVAACDKRHNLSAIIADFRVQGPQTFERFNAPAEQQLQFYRDFSHRAADRLPPRLRLDLEALVAELEEIVIARYPVSQPGDA
jgi:(p)ppGpp synthase/HD superfamily hydrolase